MAKYMITGAIFCQTLIRTVSLNIIFLNIILIQVQFKFEICFFFYIYEAKKHKIKNFSLRNQDKDDNEVFNNNVRHLKRKWTTRGRNKILTKRTSFNLKNYVHKVSRVLLW